MKKKKLVLFTLLCIPVFSLTACSDFFDMFYFFGIDPTKNANGGYQSISTPPAGDDTPHYAPNEYTYDTYIKNNCYPLSATPATGTANILVIPIWFSDSSQCITITNREQVRQDIQKAYFGSNDDTGWRSVKTYYEEESHGKLTITGKVSDWFECGQSSTKYAIDDDTDSGGNVPKTRSLLDKAITWYFNNNPSDNRKNYDCDGDGYIDGLMLIYAAPDYQAWNNNNYTNLWAYCYWIQDKTVKDKNNPGVNAFFWASYDYMYGSSVAKSRTGSSFSNGDTAHAHIDAHTYIHEMGHMFGLMDYYDYTRQYNPSGDFSMQDANLGGHDPFSSFALGWGQAYVPTESTTIDLKPFATSGELIVLKPKADEYSYSPFDEYLVLEYYTPTGLNEFDCTHKYMSTENKNYPIGSKTPGIRLWHVDARLVYPRTLSGGRYIYDKNNVVRDPSYVNTYGVTLMMSNTYYKSAADDDYISPLGRDYSDYNLLQLIRNSTTDTYRIPAKSSGGSFSSGSLFTYGDVFTMEKYNKQFVNYTAKDGKVVGLFNTNEELPFSFEVNACKQEYASITITKI